MHVLLNKIPSIVYEKTAYISLLEEGYALAIETRDNATVLRFKDVEDHVDDNTEHGFESADYCLAVSFDIGLTKECSPTFINETLDAFVKPHRTHHQFSGPAPNF